jgi:AraC-like DNA-binding protein
VPHGAAFLANWRQERDIWLYEGAEWLTVGLQAHLLGRDLLPLIGLPVLWTPEIESRASFEFCLRELARLHPCEGALALVCDGLSRVLTGLVLSAHNVSNVTPGGQGSAPSWLGRVQRMAKDNPGVSVAQLAREAGFSPAQFRRVFHDWAKMSPHEFLQRERLELASKLLDSTNFSVEEIARRCGFSNASTFARTFRAFANFSPAAYRLAVRHMAQEQA